MTRRRVEVEYDIKLTTKRILELAGSTSTPESIAAAAAHARQKYELSMTECETATYYHAVRAGFHGHQGEWSRFLVPILKAGMKVEAEVEHEQPDPARTTEGPEAALPEAAPAITE